MAIKGVYSSSYKSEIKFSKNGRKFCPKTFIEISCTKKKKNTQENDKYSTIFDYKSSNIYKFYAFTNKYYLRNMSVTREFRRKNETYFFSFSNL